MDSQALTVAMDGFATFLFSFSPDAYGVQSLLSSRLSRAVLQHALRSFAQEYAELSAAIHDPANKYEFPSTLVARTPSEVETILGVEPEQPASA